MVNPNTPRQNRRKRTFSNATQAWRNLTDGNRSAWNAYANAFPIPSRKNPSSYLSGLAAFTRWHGVRFQDNSTVLANPSGDQGTAVVDQVDLVLSAGSLFVSVPNDITEGPWQVFVYLSRPLQATQAFVKSWQRFIISFDSESASDINISTIYVGIFGALPALGALLGVQIVFLNRTNGQVLFGAPAVQPVTV